MNENIPSIVYLQSGFFSKDEENVANYFGSLGSEVEIIPIKPIQRKIISLKPNGFACGIIQFVHAALKSYGKVVPKPDDYPECLRHLLKRKIWKGKLKDINGRVFVKPMNKEKVFTGKVLCSYSDIPWVSKNMQCWFSDIVSFSDEYRVYVMEGKILGGHYCDRNRTDAVETDMDVVEEAVRLIGKKTIVLDFGLIDKKETALVEANAPYSVGNYGLSYSDYAKFLFSGWKQIINE